MTLKKKYHSGIVIIKEEGETMNKALKAEIIKWLLDNEKVFCRVNECHNEFRLYIYNPAGEYLIGGKEVSDFICDADKLLYE